MLGEFLLLVGKHLGVQVNQDQETFDESEIFGNVSCVAEYYLLVNDEECYSRLLSFDGEDFW